MLQPVDSAPATTAAEPNGGDVLMTQAEDLLGRGLHVEAVNLAHRAYEEASLDGGIFARMLRVHLKAALALDQPEQYTDAIQLLMCAHSHDQTDRSVHQALATRHFQHARAMHERGDDDAALTAVKIALRYDPKHSEAQSMFDLLSGSAASKAR